MTRAGAAMVASNHHYEMDPRIFELFLDPTLKYSSGLYLTQGDSLDQAQQQKLDYIARQLEVTPESTVLDVGCGWGSLTCYLAREIGCRVIGITPTPVQADYVRARLDSLGLADRARILVSSFEEVDLDHGSVDAVSFVGSIVHVMDKRSALVKCYKMCRHQATVYLSETCFRNRAKQNAFDMRPGTEFVRNDIFGQGELLTLSSYIAFLEDAGFSLAGLRDLTSDYHRTIEHWRQNAHRNCEALEAIDPGIIDRLDRYFDVANAGWGYTSKQYAIVAKRKR